MQGLSGSTAVKVCCLHPGQEQEVTSEDAGRLFSFCPYSHLFPALMIKKEIEIPKNPSSPSPTLPSLPLPPFLCLPSLHHPPFHPSLGLLPTIQLINCLRAVLAVTMTTGPVQREPQVFLFGLRSRWFLNSTVFWSSPYLSIYFKWQATQTGLYQQRD